MAHFAELKEETDQFDSSKTNLVVQRVVVVANDIETAAGPLGENDLHVDGETWCANFWGGTWKQTSYNTKKGQHTKGGTPFRKNFAGKGYTYDASRDAFIPPKPYNSWTLNETTCLWEAPVSKPGGDNIYEWNEDTTSWDLVHQAGIG